MRRSPDFEHVFKVCVWTTWKPLVSCESQIWVAAGREAELKVWGPVRVSGYILISALDKSQKQTLQIQGMDQGWGLVSGTSARWGSPRAQLFLGARMPQQWPGKTRRGGPWEDTLSPCSVSAPELPVPQCLWDSTAVLALKAPGAHCSGAPTEICMQRCCVWYETCCRGGMAREGGREILGIISGLYPRVPFVHISIHSRIKYFLLKHFFPLAGSHSTPIISSIVSLEAKLQGTQVKTWQLECKASAETESFY